VADRIEKKLVEPNDLLDNAVDIFSKVKKNISPYLIEDGLEIFNLTWLEDEGGRDAQFEKAVKIAKEILLREIKVWSDRIKGEKEVERFYAETADKRIIIMDRSYPWEEVLNKYPEPLYAVEYRKSNDQWGAAAVRDDISSFKCRQLFPKEWGGKRDEELAKISGVPDALYCQHALWLAVAKTKEGAIALAKKSIGIANKK
jgi:uncharacterized UPF0160 family protein